MTFAETMNYIMVSNCMSDQDVSYTYFNINSRS